MNEELSPQDRIANEWKLGDFDVKLNLEIDCQDKSRPFIIWRKEENKPTATNKRTIAQTVPFVQHLDHVHGVLDTVIRYQKEGMRVAYHNIPTSPDSERDGELQEIREYLASREREASAIRDEVIKEYGIKAKLEERKKQAKEQMV